MIPRLKLDLLLRECVIEILSKLDDSIDYTEYTLLDLLEQLIFNNVYVDKDIFDSISNKYINENNMSKKQVDAFLSQLSNIFYH